MCLQVQRLEGEWAMGMAFLYPEPEMGGRGKKGKSSVSEGFSSTRLSNARQVLRFSRELRRLISQFRQATPYFRQQTCTLCSK